MPSFLECPVPQVLGSAQLNDGYWIDPTSLSGNLNQQTSQHQESYWVRADRLFEFVSWCAGSTQSIGTGGAIIAQQVPVSSRHFPNLLAQQISWELHPAGPSDWTAANPYSVGRVTIGFGSVPYQTEGDSAFRSVESEGTATMISVPGSVYRFADGVFSDTGASVLLSERNYTVTVYRQANPNIAAMDAICGSVNQFAFSILGHEYPPTSLLFTASGFSIAQSLLGSPQYNVRYSISWRSQSWNSALHPNGTTGFAPIEDGTGNPPFASSDWGTVFPGGL